MPHDKDNAFSIRTGHFMGQNSIAVQAAFRLSSERDVVFDFGAAVGLNHSQSGFSAGVTWRW